MVDTSMSAPSPVLLSWIAVTHDPFEPDRKGNARPDASAAPSPIPGPTLCLLFDEESPFNGRIRDIVFLQRSGIGSDREQSALDATIAEINRRQPDTRIERETWQADDPTDHKAVFEFLRERIPKIRRRFAGRELVIHVSPGTPSMHTVWVLMAETGFIEPPFRAVQSYRKSDRRGRPATVPVELGIETFYKAYRASRPRQATSDEEAILWDPGRFQSPRLKALFVEARRFAHLKVPVLILGERGTGKTTLATWMRLHSPFRRDELDRCWPVVACGQYTPETMRAELFGYIKGAFTDAKEDRDGLLVSAHEDTLFLDEIGDISKDLQRLLIKALEEKRFFPLGAAKPRDSDFRLLTATNLPMAVLRERLDPDFLDRIGLLELRLPPLREIREDLPWLWEQVHTAAARRAGVSARQARVSQAHHERLVRAFQEHPLPGNIRDLFRVAYRLLSARSDPHEPLAPADAVDYAVEGLGLLGRSGEADVDQPRAVARAYAASEPLDPVLPPGTRLATATLDRNLKTYLAGEIRRMSRERRVPPEALCDVTERSLRAWAQPTGRKRSSVEPED
ncbi:sigma 54-interacting transcriptional regulator [Sorangium sp. So ce136]|uniref:sigma 54-interacting transcriptional regulator n=1 Tax=Sorangium sp. So ce136 TaxID=3133284 RepID=UPI003EFF710B